MNPSPEQPVSAAEQKRREHYAQKQEWKEQPGNRYTADELHHLADSFGPFTLHKRRTKVMHLD
jgi:hypothetical protein